MTATMTGHAPIGADILSRAELIALSDCEERIERGMKTFIEVGQSLAAIRENRLYRATHDTFEEYCRGRWGFNRHRASQLISAVDVVTNVTSAGLPAPANEGQARALAKLPEADRAEVWREVNEAPGRVTAEKIREVAEERAKPAPLVEPKSDVGPDVLRALTSAGAAGMTAWQVAFLLDSRSPDEDGVREALFQLCDVGKTLVIGQAEGGALWALTELVDDSGATSPAPESETCLGTDMDCGRPLPCPDHPRTPEERIAAVAEVAPEFVKPVEPDPVAAVAAALDKHVPDPDAPKRAWQQELCVRLEPISRLTLWLDVDQAAQFADDTDVETLRQLALSFTDLHRRVVAARTAPVTPLRRIK